MEGKTWICNLISVPQITRFLLGQAIISSKINPHDGSKKKKRSYGKIKSNICVQNIAIYSNSLA